MKYIKYFVLVLLFFTLVGCDNKKTIDYTIDEINEKELREFLDKYQYDIKYPYAFDYLVKQYIDNLENENEFKFTLISEKELTIGSNEVSVEVGFPDGNIERYSFVLNVVDDMESNYGLDRFTFNKETQTLESYNGHTDVVIPPMIDGVEVLKIGENCFKGSEIVAVYVPDTVVEIGDMAFYDCYHFKKFRMGKNIIAVGEFAFSGTELEEIKINNNVINDYGNFVFYNTRFEKLTIDDEVDMDLLLKNWNRLGIDPSAIPNIKHKKNFYYLESNKTVYGLTGYYDANRMSIDSTELGIERINDYLFYGDLRLNTKGAGDYYFGSSVKYIGSYAFYNAQISGLYLPEGLEEIAEYAFMNSAIEYLNIPNSLVKIAADAFLNTDIKKIELDENENRFNDDWEVIGFPSEIKPIIAEYNEPLIKIVGENDEYIKGSIRVGNIIYGVGYTWSKDLDFKSDLKPVILPFLFKYNLETNTYKFNLLDLGYESSYDDIVQLSDGTFIVMGYLGTEVPGNAVPYFIKFNDGLDVLSKGQIHDDNMRIILDVAVNDKNQIGVISENRETKWYDFIIFDENFKELYRYLVPRTYNSWNAQFIKVQGGDFIFYGSAHKTNDRHAFVTRLNTEGVVFEYFFDGGIYAEINHLEILNDKYFLNIYTENNGLNIHYYTYLSFSGVELIELSSFNDFEYSFATYIQKVGDMFYVFSKKDMTQNNTYIVRYDLDMNYIDDIYFSRYIYAFPKLYEYQDEIYILISSNDKYFHGGNNPNGLNILILKLDFN